MYCKNCGQIVSGNSDYCPYCAEKIANKDIKNEVIRSKGPWNAFAIIGKVLGIVSLSLSWIPVTGLILTLFLGLDAIIFSLLGKKSTTHYHQANTGIRLSIISILISTFIFVIFLMITA